MVHPGTLLGGGVMLNENGASKEVQWLNLCIWTVPFGERRTPSVLGNVDLWAERVLSGIVRDRAHHPLPRNNNLGSSSNSRDAGSSLVGVCGFCLNMREFVTGRKEISNHGPVWCLGWHLLHPRKKIPFLHQKLAKISVGAHFLPIYLPVIVGVYLSLDNNPMVNISNHLTHETTAFWLKKPSIYNILGLNQHADCLF